MSLVTFDAVSMSFGLRRRAIALKSVNISIQKGERIVIVGPNGAGKTTFFKLLLGLLRPTRGRVVRDTVRGVGYAPEYPALLSKTTAAEILDAVTSDWRSQLLESLAWNGLEDLLLRRMDRLSKGQSQMASLAIAMAGRLPVVVLDEPFEGLDPTGPAGGAPRHRSVCRIKCRDNASDEHSPFGRDR